MKAEARLGAIRWSVNQDGELRGNVFMALTRQRRRPLAPAVVRCQYPDIPQPVKLAARRVPWEDGSD
jgi:hypothetical protein